MSQNTTHAVMQQRSEADDSLDDFPTPPHATRAMVEHVLIPNLLPGVVRLSAVREPCANRGCMVLPLQEYFGKVIPSDIHDYGVGYPVEDYLFPGPMVAAEFTVMNAPFRLGLEFILRSFETPGWRGTAAIVRSAFLEGDERFRKLFFMRRPSIVAQHVERVIMTKGTCRDPSKEYWDADKVNKDGSVGGYRRPSTATSYCWLIWLRDDPWNCTRMMWIPPCRKLLERPGDYSIITETHGEKPDASQGGLAGDQPQAD